MRFALVLLVLAAPRAGAQTYFPPAAPGGPPTLSDAAARAYSVFLKALHEPSLWELSQQDPAAQAYRLLWLRASDRPVSIRLAVKPGGTGWFYRRATGGTGGTRPGRVSEYSMSWSWHSRTASFLGEVEQGGFWNLATLADAGGAAGPCRAHWILEGVRGGRYQLVDRCAPDGSDPVRQISLRMVKLSGMRVRRSQIY